MQYAVLECLIDDPHSLTMGWYLAGNREGPKDCPVPILEKLSGYGWTLAGSLTIDDVATIILTRKKGFD